MATKITDLKKSVLKLLTPYHYLSMKICFFQNRFITYSVKSYLNSWKMSPIYFEKFKTAFKISQNYVHSDKIIEILLTYKLDKQKLKGNL